MYIAYKPMVTVDTLYNNLCNVHFKLNDDIKIKIRTLPIPCLQGLIRMFVLYYKYGYVSIVDGIILMTFVLELGADPSVCYINENEVIPEFMDVLIKYGYKKLTQKEIALIEKQGGETKYDRDCRLAFVNGTPPPLPLLRLEEISVSTAKKVNKCFSHSVCQYCDKVGDPLIAQRKCILFAAEEEFKKINKRDYNLRDYDRLVKLLA